MRVTRSPWSSSVAPKGRDHAGRTCLSAAHETGRPTAAGFRKPFHIRAFGPNAASGNPPALLPRQDDLKVLCSRDQVALSRRGRSGTASVEAVAYGKVGPVRLESTGHCATATTGFAAATHRATRGNLRRDARRLESIGTCGLSLSRFVSAAVALGTRWVYLSATLRRYGESARFRPGGVVDPDTRCCLAGPRGADLD